VNDEFKKALLVWAAALALTVIVETTCTPMTDEGRTLWAKFLAGLMLFLFLGAIFGVPLVQGMRRPRALAKADLLFHRRGTSRRSNWPRTHGDCGRPGKA
jgi:hypothetical protein